MNTVEIASAGIVVLLVAALVRGERSAGRYLFRLLLMAAAGWVAEDTCIRLYQGYGYADTWTLWLDRVPVLVVVIWPTVLMSAYKLALSLAAGKTRWAWMLGGMIVTVDAALIEPVAVHAGLWSWHEPGLFDVPIVGVLGWGLFALACLGWLAFVDERKLSRTWDIAALFIAPLVVHAGVLALWWGAFRWMQVRLPAALGVTAAWLVSVVLTGVVWPMRARGRLSVLLSRVPAALFFFILLGWTVRGRWDLVAYAAAFAPPYLVLFMGAVMRAAVREG